MFGYYDKEGNEITFEHWCVLFSDPEYCTIRLDKIGDSVEVSTVWMGLNYNFGRGDTPIIFETMTFGGDEECYRYATEEEAIAGHEKIVAELKLLAEACS